MADLLGTTTNFNFRLINFNVATWHNYEYDNWRALDAILNFYLTIGNLQGVWQNSTAYTTGQKAIDTTDSTIWEVSIDHTSASSGTFAADRTANPTYWIAVGSASAVEQAERAAISAKNAVQTAMQFARQAELVSAGISADVATFEAAQLQAERALAVLGNADQLYRRTKTLHDAVIAAGSFDQLHHQVYGLG